MGLKILVATDQNTHAPGKEEIHGESFYPIMQNLNNHPDVEESYLIDRSLSHNKSFFNGNFNNSSEFKIINLNEP
jgi:hypothetical protein